MDIGIDQFAIATPNLYIDLRELAAARGVEPDKYTIGIGQDQQAVPPSSQDVVTLGAAAAQQLAIDPARLGLIVLGTESGIDASKAGALYIQELLDLPRFVRAIEIKQACYGGTAGLMMARDYIASHPGQTALVIAADIARYGLGAGGEVTQGAGAVAMLLSEGPRIMTIEPESAYFSEQVMDFWRPVYTDEAIALGKYSTEQYLRFFETVLTRYQAQTGRTIRDFSALTFHLPYTKMGRKALQLALPDADTEQETALLAHFDRSIQYSRRIGNIYTGSLYLSLVSLLELDDTLKAGDRIGLFSYGSGAVGEFFSGQLVAGYQAQLHAAFNARQLDARVKLTIPEYEAVFQDAVPYSPADYAANPAYFAGPFVLNGVQAQKRIYQAHVE